MTKHKLINRNKYLLVAIVLVLAVMTPLLNFKSASAALITERAIKLSSSAVSGSSVSYHVSFKAGTTATVKSIAVDFCANSPIINDTCTATVGTTTPTVTTSFTAGNFGSGWTATLTNSSRTFTLANATGQALTSGTTYDFTLTGVTNQTTNGTFYGRILTFPNDATSNYAGGYTGTNVGANVPTDSGGVAMSLADQITIQAKVQERITFCIYTSAVNYTSCTGPTTTNPVALGDANGVLSSTLPSINKTAKYNITTNASTGAVIRAQGTTLTSGAFTVSAIAAGAAAGGAYATNTEQFGLCTYRDTGGGTTGLTPDNNYDGDSGGTTSTACTGTTAGQSGGFDNSAQFTFDTVTAADNITTTYGDTIATKTAGDFSTGILTFLGGVTNTTEPGIYNATLTFIATGTY